MVSADFPGGNPGPTRAKSPPSAGRGPAASKGASVHHWSHPVPVATTSPLLRVVLILLLMVSVLAGVLVASNAQIGWLTLAFVVVAGPVAVVVEGRSRNRSRADRADRTRGSAMEHAAANWEPA